MHRDDSQLATLKLKQVTIHDSQLATLKLKQVTILTEDERSEIARGLIPRTEMRNAR